MPSIACRFHVLTCVGWSCRLAAISCTVLSPRSASSATAALNWSEKFRRFVILVSIRSGWIHLSTLSEFAGPLHPIREPDIRAFQTEDGEWRVELNKATLPSIRVDEEMGREVRKVTMQDADKEFVRGSLQSARWLTRAAAQRNETNLKVAAEIVRYQKAFLEQGMHQMRPLKLKLITDNVGVHESTISRVTSAMMMQTPQGSFPLRIFFSTAIESDDSEEGASAMMICEKIRKMIFAELPKRPLSDDTIKGQLHDQGLRIARRTVAKYRKLDSIPSSSQRRRGYQLQAMM